ncbi:MAG: AAA family ATPase [Dehalococcoidia bacterium]|nr:AAA family ATPase [Dehalococcoidia bacterium]
MNQVLILTGPPGAGKTSVALAICERFDRMVHVPVDDLRHWVRAGYRHPWAGDAQAAEQLRMAIDGASALARNAVDYRYSVIVDDVVVGADAEAYRAALAGLDADVQMVTLLPSLEDCLERDAARGAASIPERVRALHEEFASAVTQERQSGAVLDTSDDASAYMTADRVQDAISRGLARLKVDA